MRYFIQWVVVFSLIVLGVFVAINKGLFVTIYDSDITKLSFVILAMFLFKSLAIGWHLGTNPKDLNFSVVDNAVYFADMFTKLGFVGTIAGFLYAFQGFDSINIADIASTQSALICVAIGMRTALWTTIIGLICSIALRFQIYIYEKVG